MQSLVKTQVKKDGQTQDIIFGREDMPVGGLKPLAHRAGGLRGDRFAVKTQLCQEQQAVFVIITDSFLGDCPYAVQPAPSAASVSAG